MDPKKRILIFSLAYYPVVGGAEVAIKEITDRILDTEFVMITRAFSKNAPREEKIGNVLVHRIKCSKNLFPFRAHSLASKLHKIERFDAIWAMMANWAGFAALFFKMKYAHVPFILTLQEGDPLEYIQKKVRFVYPLFQRIFRRANIVQAISIFLGNWATEMGYKGNVEIIPNGVDFELFNTNYSEAELDELRKSLDKHADDVFIITTSRLVEKNAVEDVIEALKSMPKNFKFLILGTGPLESVLKQKVKTLSLEDRVIFVGFVAYKDIPKYLKISSVFIRPSLSEGMGNSFIEAMAAGVPVVATPVGGIVDFLYDPEVNPEMPSTGLFVPVKSPRLIAFQVQKLVLDRVLRDKIIINAKRMVEKNYDWDLIAQQMQSRVFNTI